MPDRLSQVRNPGEPELPSEPLKIETEDIFDSEPADDPFEDNPMKMLRGMMGDLRDMTLNRPSPMLFMPPPSEHKVYIFRLNDRAKLTDIASKIEVFLNDGWTCHHPTVCNDYVLMDFSRRKETEENGKQ